jgi:hypothetical protein
MTTGLGKLAAAWMIATVAVAVGMLVHLEGQKRSEVSADFRNAAVAEIRDSQGAVLLRGNFTAAAGDDDEIDRKAALTATEHGGAATGNAEVEYRKDGATTQEVEFQVRQAPPHAVLTLVIDGTTVINTTADEQGRAEAEADVAVPRQP